MRVCGVSYIQSVYICVQTQTDPSLCAGALQGYLYAIGGNNGVASLDTCERYDPHLNKWTLIEPMKKRRAGARVAQLHSQLYVVGTTHLCCRLTTLCSLHSQLIYAL